MQSESTTTNPPQTPAPKPGQHGLVSRQMQKKRRKYIYALILLTLFALSSLVILGPKAYRWWQRRDTVGMTAKASVLLRKGNPEGAMKLLASAYRGAPNHPEVLRLLGRTLDQVQAEPSRCIFFWHRLLELGVATAQDRGALGAALLRAGRSKDARDILNDFSPEERTQRRALELEALLLRYDGRLLEADQTLRRAYESEPTDPECRLKLAMIDLTDPFPEVQERAMNTIWEVARTDSSASLNAMQTLATQPKLTAPQAAELRERIAKAPDASESQRYDVLSSYLRVLPLGKDEVIDEETDRQRGLPAEQTIDFLRWLAKNEENQRVLSLLPKEAAMRNGNLFLIYAHSLGALERWTDLRKMLSAVPGPPISPIEIDLIKARCARATGESATVTRSHLQEAQKRIPPNADPMVFMRVGNTADELGFSDVALDVFNALSTRPQFKLSVLDRVLQLHYRQHNLQAMLECIARFLEERPGQSPYFETMIYLKLLEAREIESVANQADTLAKPGCAVLPIIQLVQALAAYRYGDLEGALRAAETISLEKLTAGQRAVLAGIYHACGKTARGYQIAEKISQDILLPEEARFLRSAL